MTALPALDSRIRGTAEVRPGEDSGELSYRIFEPALSTEERRWLGEIRRRLFAVDLIRPEDPTEAEARLIERIEALARVDPRLQDPGRRARMTYYLVRDLVGFGPIDVPMRDPDIEDISCDGVGIPLFVHHRRWGSLAANLSFPDPTELDLFVGSLAQRSGRHLSVAEPLVEGTLPGGARLEASLGTQITTRGSTFTIRRFRERAFTPVDLVRSGTIDSETMAYLWLVVESGRSFVVLGGTASGKTTTLNALLHFVPAERKIVSIEDTRELHLPHENWVPLVTRGPAPRAEEAGSPEVGAIDMYDLLSAALRQRPQYLVVGEVRGREAYTVFQAMATGRTCCATFHAESLRAMVQRMENPPISLPRALLAALPVVLVQAQVRVDDTPARRVRSVIEIEGLDPETEEVVASGVYRWDADGDRFETSGQSRVLEQLARERGVGTDAIQRELDRRRSLLERWAGATERDPLAPDPFLRDAAAYARDPEGALSAALRREEASPPARTGGTP